MVLNMHDILAAGLKQQTFHQYDEKKLTNNISDKNLTTVIEWAYISATWNAMGPVINAKLSPRI
jgi:hypothetical protein